VALDRAAHSIAQVNHVVVRDPVVDAVALLASRDNARLGQQREVLRGVLL
jgi:hypothetical protein